MSVDGCAGANNDGDSCGDGGGCVGDDDDGGVA